MLKFVLVLFSGACLMVSCSGCIFSGEQDAEMAWKALQSKDNNQAIRLATRAIRFGGLSGEKLSAAYECRATASSRKKQYQRALEDLNILIAARPEYAGGYFNRAEVYLFMKNIDPAMEDLNKGFSIADPQGKTQNGSLAKRYYQRGLIWLGRKNYQEAKADFNKSMENNPDYPDAYFGRSFIFEQEKQLPKALEDIEKAYKLGTAGLFNLGFEANRKYFPRLYQLRVANGVDPMKTSEGNAEAPLPVKPEVSADPVDKPLLDGVE